MRGGTFNLLYGRDPKIVQKEVSELLIEHNLDYLGVQESTDYQLVLHDIPGYSYYTGGSVNGGASTEIGLLVKDIHDVSNVKNKAFGDGWWGVQRKGKPIRMQPRNFLVATINNKRKVAVVHYPPNVDIANGVPEDRYEDLASLSKKCMNFLSGPSFKSREILGDWNCEPYVRAKFSPKWIAYKTGATLSSPDDRIDYILTKGLKVVSIRKVYKAREKSDHELVIFVTRPKFRHRRKDK